MRFGKGDKVVIEIKDVVNDLNGPVYVTGNNSLGEVVPLDEVAEPLSKYEEPLKAKLKIQEHNIIELLKENAQLRAENNALSESLDGFKKRVDDMCEVDNGRGRIKGQQEAWELAQKICCTPIDGGFNPRELIEIFGTVPASSIFSLNTYTEAAAKVAEWERKKEEICVGDVLLSNRTGTKCIVTHIDNETVTMLWDDSSYGDRSKNFIREGFEKIGHIDIASMLAQIGGEE